MDGAQAVNIETALKEAMAIEGAIGVALVDYTSGLTLGVAGGGATMDMNVAAAGNTDVIRAKVRTLELLGMQDGIEDILITLDSQYHVIRLLQQKRHGDAFFLYLSLDKARANLGLARHQLRKIEAELDV
ncbi:hypothetical protein AB0M02_24090 [Actinoplanes sp. NPDC051861]|uniref:hypothetical protein n=1 Tax=Actinoplanes sp. NPDC051861 TaxID=3155170 RepID=UPI003414DED9